MNSNAEILAWSLFALCLALSFLLSGMEAGVFVLSRLRIRRQMRAGRRSARLLHRYLQNPEDFLWTILVGNTLANFIILGGAAFRLYDLLQNRTIAFAVVYLVLVFFFYAFFDLLPKMLFRSYPNRLCVLLAPPFRFIHLLLRPLVWLVEQASTLLLRFTGGRAFTGHLFGNREELRFLMQESAQAFSSEERAIINRVLDLQTLSVQLLTKPLDLAVMVNRSTPAGEVLALSRERRATRLPVYEPFAGGRRIVGMVSVDSLLYHPDLDPAKPVADFVRPALFLDVDTRLESALQRMRRSGQRLAVVLSRDQREIGIVSLQDILQRTFGEVSL
jgi:putative hemolysin